MNIWNTLGVSARERYFTLLLLIFMAGFALIPSSKWLNNVYYGFMALPALYVLLRFRGQAVSLNPLLWGWLLFLAWFIVPSALANRPMYMKAALYVLLFVLMLACFVSADFMRKPKIVRGLFWLVCFYVFASAFVYWVMGDYVPGNRLPGLPGRISNQIYVTSWLVCVFALAIPTWFAERRWLEAGTALVLVVVGITYVLQTRTGLVGVAFLFALVGLYMGRHQPLKAALVVIGLFVLVFGAGLLLSSQPWLASMLARADGHRLEIWHIVIGEWQACGWLTGCGLNYHSEQLIQGIYPINHPHNMFISLGVYTGLPALLLFVALMMFSLYRAYQRSDPWGLYLAVALVMLNFDGAKLVGNPDELWLLVLLPAALVAGYAYDDKRQSAAQSKSKPSLAT